MKNNKTVKRNWKPFLEVGGIIEPKRIKAGEAILNRLFNQALKDQREEIIEFVEDNTVIDEELYWETINTDLLLNYLQALKDK